MPGVHRNRATIAVVGATALVVARALPLDRAFAAIDLDTLALLFGMMVLNANLRIAGFFDAPAALMAHHATSPRRLLALVVVFAGALSALFLNDTIVIVFTRAQRAGRDAPQPRGAALADPERAWLTLVMATTLAGNLTLLGSVANLIVAESAARRGVTLGFVEYLKAGVPITVLSIAQGVLWLS